MWIIIPCKRLELAKLRLAPVLSAIERRHLAEAMLSDVLEAATATQNIVPAGLVLREKSSALLTRVKVLTPNSNSKNPSIPNTISVFAGNADAGCVSSDNKSPVSSVPSQTCILTGSDAATASVLK